MKEALSEQIHFETTRQSTDMSLWEHNGDIVGRGIPRLKQEIDELQESIIYNHPPKEQIMEAVDVVIFGLSMLAHLAVVHGVSLDEIQQMTMGKLAQNAEKYNPDYCAGRTIAETMEFAREKWNSSQ